jgi:Tfp pilus assembly protein PilW
MTLLEMLIAMSIGVVVLTSVGAFSLYGGRSFAAIANYLEMETDSRNALDTLTRDIRQATALTAYTSTQLTFQDADGQPLLFTYSPGAQTLTKTKGSQSKVLLTGCDSLSFAIFQRTPIGGTDQAYPASSAATAKLVQVTWLCSRKIIGVTANTESVQTAKIVMRKKRVT